MKEQDRSAQIIIGMGCFWGAEKLFWNTPGVLQTRVGYAGGSTENPSYRLVCTGTTGHAEVVEVLFDEKQISASDLVRIAMENHDPTQGNRQGNDIGTQYRSAIYLSSAEQKEEISEELEKWNKAFIEAGYGALTTEVALLADTPAGQFYEAEEEHQKYLAKNPYGYCPIHATGVNCG